VLDLSRIEAGRLHHEPVPTDLRQIVADLGRVHAPGAGRKGLRFELKVAPVVPPLAVLDGRHLRQVLLNLLGNAIKFTSQGMVCLQVTTDGSRHLRFEVHDTGPGIEPEHLGEIFEAFRQTRAGAAAGGTGLGLTISQRLVRAMGGTLAVESTVGKGSRFFFTLPFVPANPSGLAAYAPGVAGADARLAPGTHVTALVADDNAMNRHVLASLLESAGVHVITAAGGLEAVDHARRHRPDIILMDRRMRDLDGFEATRRIHADPDTAHIPVLAVSASAFGDSLEAARKAGCVDFLPKPVQADVLYGMLQRHLGIAFVPGVAAPPPAPVAPLTIAMPPAQALALARRLRAAASVGDVTEVDAIAAGLLEVPDGPHALGRRIVDLRSELDFDALLRLADRLESQEEMDGVID
jgi:CheY-like chemotaxis protein